MTGLNTPTGVAVDGAGNVYSADSHNTSIIEVERGGNSYNYGTNESTVYSATLTDAGTQAITGSNTVTNTTNFSVTGGSSNGCSFTSSVLGALTAGQSCTLNATLVGSGSGTVTDDLSFLPRVDQRQSDPDGNAARHCHRDNDDHRRARARRRPSTPRQELRPHLRCR